MIPRWPSGGARQRIQVLVGLGVGGHESVTFAKRPPEVLLSAANLLEGSSDTGRLECRARMSTTSDVPPG